MIQTDKPLWLEGMFVRPQHFQHQNRYLEDLLDARTRGLRPYPWGVMALEIDTAHLPLGKVALRRCDAVLPDGTVVTVSGAARELAALEIPATTANARVVLAVPRRREDGVEVGDATGTRFPRRFSRLDRQVLDTTAKTETEATATIATGVLNLSLMLETEADGDSVVLPVARVREVAANGAVLLDDDFIPPLLDAMGHPAARRLVDEVSGLVRMQQETLAGRIEAPGAGAAVSGISDFLTLQLANRYAPLLTHLRQSSPVHPEELYRTLLQMAGELATFTEQRRPTTAPTYDHDDLTGVLGEVVRRIRDALSTAGEEPAVQLPLQARRYGVYVSPIADRSLIASARFVLAVAADLAPETLRNSFPRQVKIGPVEDIRELVNVQLPGIPLQPMPAVPRQVPYHAGTTYFELDQRAELWSKMHGSAAFGLHVSGEYPGLQMAFWAIRGGQ